MFTIQNMLGQQALLSGTDSAGNTGQCVLSTQQWDDLKAQQSYDASVEAFDAAVQEFFAPIMEAADAVHESKRPKLDPVSYIVLHEGSEGSDEVPSQIIELERDSIVLRLVEENNTDRLRWVTPTEIGVLAE